MSVKSILMVCRGNICRSPMAQFYFAHQVQQQGSVIAVSSAGISALVDYPADVNACQIMKKNGIDLSLHRGRQLTENLVCQADLILVMTRSHLQHLTRQFIAATGKTFLLGHFQGTEIHDPYQQPYDAFENVYQQIELAWQDWKTRI